MTHILCHPGCSRKIPVQSGKTKINIRRNYILPKVEFKLPTYRLENFTLPIGI